MQNSLKEHLKSINLTTGRPLLSGTGPVKFAELMNTASKAIDYTAETAEEPEIKKALAERAEAQKKVRQLEADLVLVLDHYQNLKVMTRLNWEHFAKNGLDPEALKVSHVIREFWMGDGEGPAIAEINAYRAQGAEAYGNKMEAEISRSLVAGFARVLNLVLFPSEGAPLSNAVRLSYTGLLESTYLYPTVKQVAETGTFPAEVIERAKGEKDTEVLLTFAEMDMILEELYKLKPELKPVPKQEPKKDK